MITVAAAVVLTVTAFSLVPIVNQIDMASRPGAGGLSAIATAPEVEVVTDQDSSGSTRTVHFKHDIRESAAVERSLGSKSAVNESDGIEMPVLEEVEELDKARSQFVFNVADLDFTPSPYYRKSPIYPLQLRQEGVEGQVMAEFRVDREGHTCYIRITESDHLGFSASVVYALSKWLFMPGQVDGERVEFRMRITMRFRLGNKRQAEPNLFIASVE